MEKGIKYDGDKLRYDLPHPKAQEGLVKVLTFGAKKYADRNWELGMPWTRIIASLKRHLSAIEKGEDYDSETGFLHADHLQCNTHFLSSYYHIAPQFDDRPHNYLRQFKIGLDIDEVLCGWVSAWTEKFGYPIPDNWHFSYNNKGHFESMSSEEMNEFYLSLPRLIDPKDLPFEPHCYITSRSVPVELTMEWIQRNGFPTVPVYSIGFGQSKVDIAKESGIDFFVDDKFENFVELNNAGICTYLLTAPHNLKYDVGHKRINSLKDLPFLK